MYESAEVEAFEPVRRDDYAKRLSCLEPPVDS